MAAFLMARIFGPRLLSFVAAAPAALAVRTARSASAAVPVSGSSRIDLAMLATTVLLAGSELVVSLCLAAALALATFGLASLAN